MSDLTRIDGLLDIGEISTRYVTRRVIRLRRERDGRVFSMFAFSWEKGSTVYEDTRIIVRKDSFLNRHWMLER